MIKKKDYISLQREKENHKFVLNLFKKEGWDMNVDWDEADLNLIDKSKSDLPYPDVFYEEKDGEDWVDENTGYLILPDSEIPNSSIINCYYRPDSKRVWFNENWYRISYFHDGSVLDVELIIE